MKCPEFQIDPPRGSIQRIKRVTRIAAMLKVRTFILICLLLGAITGYSCTCSTSACIEETQVSGEWSFAIITDLHIGRGYTIYDRQDYYLTKRLEEIVNWINDNGTSFKIKFVVVLGDISENGEYKELNKASQILGGLSVPYIPIIGNHDVSPSYDDDGNKFPGREGENLEHFGRVFEPYLHSLSGHFDTWTEDLNDKYNYAFTYDDVSFIFLDYVKRDKKGSPEPFGETNCFLKANLVEGKKVIIFSHYPIRSSIIKMELEFSSVTVSDAPDILENYRNMTWHFAGHYHGFPWEEIKFVMAGKVDPYKNANIKLRSNFLVTPIPVVLTEATMVGSNTKQPKSIIRIVTMTDDSSFNCIYCPKEQFMLAANPRFNNHSRLSFPFSSFFLPQSVDTQQEFNATCYSKLDISNWEWRFGSLLKEGKTVYVTAEEIQQQLNPNGGDILPVTLNVTYNQNMNEEDIVYNIDFNQIFE
jgi:hypothetical protein